MTAEWDTPGPWMERLRVRALEHLTAAERPSGMSAVL